MAIIWSLIPVSARSTHYRDLTVTFSDLLAFYFRLIGFSNYGVFPPYFL